MKELFDRREFFDRLANDASQIGVTLDSAQIDKLIEYLAQMLRWNRTYNLTAIREPEAMRVQHLVDSLAVVPLLAQRIALDGDAVGAQQAARIMDVGSGGGLPGVVLAIAQPGWQVCCVDAVEKKTAFVRQMAGVLQLPNLSAQHTRVERLPPAQCDIVVSRAFASVADFAALAGRHVRPDGTLAAMKGREPSQELSQLHAAGEWRLDVIHTLQVPGLDAQRCMAFLVRT